MLCYQTSSLLSNQLNSMQFNNLFNLWQRINQLLQEPIEAVSHRIDDEMLLTVSQKQINEALHKFVTRNVQAILNMRIELNDGWFRLYCTVNIAGIHAQVAGNFKLVHIQLDRYHQRLVFAQQGSTEVLELHAASYLKRIAIQNGLKLYRKITGDDPLGMILQRIKLARVKDNVFYIDIGRWLRKNEKIMTNLYKFQVNYGVVEPEQLVLKSQINFRDLLAGNASGDLITDSDNPEPENVEDELDNQPNSDTNMDSQTDNTNKTTEKNVA